AANREDGSGAVFTVTLPVASKEMASAGAAPPAVLDEAGNGSGVMLKGVRVLVVEDEPDARELITLMLSRCGAEVQPAGSSAEALEIVGRRVPDVIVSDLEMPEESGYELITKIRQLPGERGGAIPAIALTAYA